MSIKKRSAKCLEKGKTRSSAIKLIDPLSEVSTTMTITDYLLNVEILDQEIVKHNDLLGLVDESANKLDELVKTLNLWNSRFLALIAAKYGRASNEYEKAGGVRTSDRKKPVRKVVPPKV